MGSDMFRCLREGLGGRPLPPVMSIGCLGGEGLLEVRPLLAALRAEPLELGELGAGRLGLARLEIELPEIFVSRLVVRLQVERLAIIAERGLVVPRLAKREAEEIVDVGCL